MKAGDELRLDTIRFLLLAPGQEMGQAAARNEAPTSAAPAPRPAAKSSRTGLMWAIVAVAILSLSAVAARLMGAF